ncbi:MAG: lipopolysaccharide heptosyltransferase II [Nitrospirae bacterium]|nr:lipopolysaccharide heptosyltransferase II [Nitrospirota bacterium]MCL5977696.1 lipopolysaccharide heptosyltransferase II [Nitrospirota bacterium]
MTDKILIRGVNWIGDAVMTMPAIKALKKAYPESKLNLLVKPSVAPIFEKDQDIDEIISYEDRFKGVFGRLKLAYALRKKGFSKAFLFQNAFDAALIAFLSGIPERIGYDRDCRKFLLTKPIAFNNDDRKLHHMDYYLNILKASGIAADCSDPWIHLSIDERLSARNVLSQLKRPVLGINPGAAYGPAKRWLPERFAEVAGWFIKDTGGSVVIFGGRDEEHIAYEIDKRIPENKLFLAGKTSLRELVSLISECDIFLTNDSGPMHVAYAVGTPLIAIFGSTDHGLTGPSGNNNMVIKADLACGPCFERECKNRDTRCMYSVSSEDVYFAIKDMLPSTKAVFFDRDGTLCKDADYLNNWKDFEVFPDLKSLAALKEKDFMLIGVSNQSGIARGIVDEPFVKEINNLFIDKYGLDDFYYCPHGPDEHCSCRKPEPGMLFSARGKHKIDLKESFVVGDKDADMLLAKAVGAKGILVRTGKQQESEYADFTASNLKEAADLIMSHG